MIGFVHISKTAGTTMKFILRNSFFLRHCDVVARAEDRIFSEDDLRFTRRFFPLLRSISGHGLINPTERLSDPIRYFTFLREPLRRCASQFQHQVQGTPRKRSGPKEHSFARYIQNERFRNRQVRSIVGCEDVEKAKRVLQERYFFVGLVERFQESLHLLQRACPYELDLRHERLNVARSDSIKNQLLADPQSVELLREANAQDLELYDFVVNELYPAQLERWGPVTHADLESMEGQLPPRYRYLLCRMHNNLYREATKARRAFGKRSAS